MERIDGISLFYLDLQNVNKIPIPFTLGPTILNNTDNIFKVFDHPINIYLCNLITLPNQLVSFNFNASSNTSMPQTGVFRLNDISLKYFYKNMNKLMEFNTNKVKTDGKRYTSILY